MAKIEEVKYQLLESIYHYYHFTPLRVFDLSAS